MARRSTSSRSRIGSRWGNAADRRKISALLGRVRCGGTASPLLSSLTWRFPNRRPSSQRAPHSAIDRGSRRGLPKRLFLPHLSLISELRIGRRCHAAWPPMKAAANEWSELLAPAARSGADQGSEPRAWRRDRPRLRCEGSIRNAVRPVTLCSWSRPATRSIVHRANWRSRLAHRDRYPGQAHRRAGPLYRGVWRHRVFHLMPRWRG
jgi:hypothetical protein